MANSNTMLHQSFAAKSATVQGLPRMGDIVGASQSPSTERYPLFRARYGGKYRGCGKPRGRGAPGLPIFNICSCLLRDSGGMIIERPSGSTCGASTRLGGSMTFIGPFVDNLIGCSAWAANFYLGERLCFGGCDAQYR